ncbi:WD repeat-containing protein-like protein [Lindgomyces ingoldianus]|uniref:WD repeat-containing protein-like protein n=1 Tax=Lindgomyces ingoldianus TaxID=673940 RepID=A0ACB6QRW4_9PLEO|nr:WD repeat-containing protein-like protein [Lindgomyces ingoldianus]KAF2468845.1 WD repeat-containing protein-like protein [Lindgomyces ingoldianus]
MATGSATPSAAATSAGPPTQKVSDVISSFRPSRRFKPGDSRTSVTSLDFDDTGELAIVARDDDTLQIYNCKEGKHAKELKSQKYGVHLARFSHHAQSIIYASTKVDDTIRFLSTHDNSYIRYFRGHTDTVTSISLCPSSDTFISCSRDNTVRIWNLQSNNHQGLLRLHAPYLAAYDPSATVIAIASPPTHSVLLYDIRNYDKAPFATFDLLDLEQRFLGPQGGDWTKMEFTNDGKSLVISTTGTGHFILDAFSGELSHFCYRKSGHSGRLAPGASPPGHGANITNGTSPALGQGDVCVTPDGQYLVGGSGDDGLLVWDISKPPAPNNFLEPVEKLPGYGKAAVVGYNPRTNVLASADHDLLLWQPDPDLMM